MKSKGFTLIDLMAAVSIAAIVLFAGIPSLGSFVECQRAGQASQTVLRALAAARESAILSNSPVSICTSLDGVNCEKLWGGQLIIFTDPDGKGQLTEPGQIIHTLGLESGWRARWSAFGNRPQLTLSGEGYTLHQNGSFYLCPDKDKGLGRRIAVNKAGRGRVVSDDNGSGYSQMNDGKDMSC